MEGLSHDEVRAFAATFSDLAAARRVLRASGWKPGQIPWSVSNADQFWHEVSDLLAQGVVTDGRRRLLAEAARLRPGNPLFASDRDGQPPGPELVDLESLFRMGSAVDEWSGERAGSVGPQEPTRSLWAVHRRGRLGLASWLVVGVAAMAAVAIGLVFAVGKGDSDGDLAGRRGPGATTPPATPTTGSSDPGFVCAGTIVTPTRPASATSSPDYTGDACGHPDFPKADIGEARWSVSLQNLTFIVSFGPTVTGGEAASIHFGATAAEADDWCAGFSLTLGYPAGVASLATGCDERGTTRSLFAPALDRRSGEISATIPRAVLPTASKELYVRVEAFTVLPSGDTTVISDHLPEEDKPPVTIPLT